MIERRIVYYTRKVAELTSIHPARRTQWHKRRGDRLLKYKAELNRRIKERRAHLWTN